MSNLVAVLDLPAASERRQYADPRMSRWAPTEGSQEQHRIGPNRARDCHELDHVEPALAALVLGDERLWPPKPLGQGLLRQPSLFGGPASSDRRRRGTRG